MGRWDLSHTSLSSFTSLYVSIYAARHIVCLGLKICVIEIFVHPNRMNLAEGFTVNINIESLG